MFLKHFYLLDRIRVTSIRNWRYNMTSPENNVHILCKYLKINKSQAQYLQIKHPVLNKITNEKMKSLIDTLNELGFSNEVLILNPALCGIVPITLKYRYMVLKECGLQTVTPTNLLIYINLMKQKTIGQLRSEGYLDNNLNIENRLASFMTHWPTSLTTLIYNDVNTISLYSLRLKIMQRYLELVLDVNNDEFFRGLQTYPTIKHRPLEVINDILKILQTQIMMPSSKIKANMFLVHANPDNLKKLIYSFRSIGGIDIKEIIRLHPRIAMRNYVTMLETRKVLQEFNISNEAQIRCFEIYTLSPETIRERLEKAQSMPEFMAYLQHPRFLKMIYYNKTATERLMKLYKCKKKCISLNVLSSCSSHYEAYEKAPGDCFGKGKDTVFCVYQILDNAFSSRDIRKALKRHPFWINVPLIQIRTVSERLLEKYTTQDIYDNCLILLYPWKKIKDVMNILNCKKMNPLTHDHIDMSKLNNSQKLSLMLYLLEKNHYFSGNGVWTEETKITNNENYFETNNVEIKIKY